MLYLPLAGVTAGAITAGGTSQVAQAASSRSYIFIQNTSDTAMYLNFGAAATSGHILLAANGGSWTNHANSCPVQSINVLCATTGKTYALVAR
jgi:hypothetical protein